VPGDLIFEQASDAAQADMDVDNEDMLPDRDTGDARTSMCLDGVQMSVYSNHPPDQPDPSNVSKSKPRWEAPKVRVLTEDDVSRYSIFDVIMPLPGKDVAFPGGSLGELYREFLVKDGLDPDNFDRKQK
jgi:tRNA pseudouridine13 synthase